MCSSSLETDRYPTPNGHRRREERIARSQRSGSTPAGSPRRASPTSAARPRISKRTLYQRFGSKDGLVVAAYESLDEPVYRHVHRADRGGDRRSPRAARCVLRAARAAPRLPRVPRLPVHERRERASRPRRIPPTPSSAGTRSGCGAGYAIGRAPQEQRNPDELSRRLALLFAGAQAEALVQRSKRPARDARQLAAALVAQAIRANEPRSRLAQAWKEHGIDVHRRGAHVET